ncbi:hypothetical protein PTTG_11820 [Puccinia triticina 1-1 BBBD Race 1]|uniref:Tet-like 2OG-Fe(II) oxygenase domain-containing protein n=1 Tax=Puccinia triticina (isolate 1-1 / race 1 (BBBD)) TaxID=630390 RepID=A0A180G4V8_PUCT1|nr:hypothetical protein PTTG_11820 [Puccinia triticina 1-1 BBBD Race 1]
MSTSFPLQPPLPRTRSGSTVYFPLVNPPIIFSFGGSFNGVVQGDLYSFSSDPDTPTPNLTAKVVATRGPAPTPRSDPLLAAADGHLFLWAGITNTDHSEHDTQLYSLLLATSSWSRYRVVGTCPAAMFGSTTTIFEGFFYVYAGTDPKGYVHDSLCRIDLDHLNCNSFWEKISYPCPPAARTGHSAIVYASAWIVFGGSSSGSVFNDVWEYNFWQKVWKSVACSGLFPPLRQNHSALRLGDKMIILGGLDGEKTNLSDIWALDLLSYVWYQVASEGTAEMMNCGQLTAAWGETVYLFGGDKTTSGLPLTPSLYHTLDCSEMVRLSTNPRDFQLAFGALSDTILALPLEMYPTNDPPPGKRLRMGKDAKRFARDKAKREAPLCNPGQHTNIYHRTVPPSRQHDPCPKEEITSDKTIREEYVSLTHGVCIVAPNNLPPFFMVAWYPFETMAASKYKGWEKFVLHLLSRIDYVAEINTKGPQRRRSLWGNGWRKCSKNTEHFGRFCSLEFLRKQMKLLKFDPEDQKACLLEAGQWISDKLRSFAPGVHEANQELLIANQYPSMNHTEYGEPYTLADFSSFLTFTMYDFYNIPHTNNDVNDWTLVGWIPIFNPKNPDNPQVLADELFDMEGGQFSFRDFQVCIDLNKTLGVTLCVFRSQDYRHQTLPGCSPTDMYTRLGFSCQINRRMAHAITAYINGLYKKKLDIGGLQNQIDNANAPPKKRKN